MHGAHQVNLQHQFKVGQIHFGKSLVAQDAGIVDQNINAAPGRHGLLHHGLHRSKIGHRRAVRKRFTASGANLRSHRFGSADRAARAIPCTAQIVDQHLGATRCQRQRMGPTQATAGTCHDGHLALEIDSHACFP